jgi:hypothetical protein
VKILIPLLVVVFLPLSASPQEAPEPSNYWTSANIALTSTAAVAASVDMGFTMRNSGRQDFQENDPLARPFVHSGPAVAGASQGLLFATAVFTSYELHRRGHDKMAKFVLLLSIGGHATGIATSSR